MVWCFFRRGERGLERNWSGRVPVLLAKSARSQPGEERKRQATGKAKDQGQATRPQSLISRGATHRRSNQQPAPGHGNAVPARRAEAEAKRGNLVHLSLSPPLAATNPSSSKHEPLFRLFLRPCIRGRLDKHASRSRANLVETGDPTTVSRHTPRSPGSQTLCDCLQKAETFIDHQQDKHSPRHHHHHDSRNSIFHPSPFQTATRYTPAARPRAAAFSCPPEPCPTFATLASPLSIPPHLSFPALPRQPNLPHSTETLARSPKEELLFGGRPYFSIYTGPDWSSTGWQSLGMYLRFCCARRDSPPERNRTHTRFFFSGVDIFGLPDLRRGLGQWNTAGIGIPNSRGSAAAAC